MTAPITVTVEGGGSFEMSAECVRELRSGGIVGRLAMESVGNTLRLNLPPELPPELDRSAWWSAHAKHQGWRVVLRAISHSEQAWLLTGPAGVCIAYKWPEVAASYTDFKRLDLDP